MRITAKGLGHGLAVLALTLISQIGGVAWLAALPFRCKRLAFVSAFVLAYGLLWIAASLLAPFSGRVALPCGGDGPLRSQSLLYCALNRNFVTPDLAALADDLAKVWLGNSRVRARCRLMRAFPLPTCPCCPISAMMTGESWTSRFIGKTDPANTNKAAANHCLDIGAMPTAKAIAPNAGQNCQLDRTRAARHDDHIHLQL